MNPDDWFEDFGGTLRHPLHLGIYDYWRRHCRDGRVPLRADIDPIAIGAAMLPWIILYDVVWRGDAPRFRFRLVGTGNVARYGRDATGLWFEELYDGVVLDEQIASYSRVAREALPDYSMRQMPVKDKEFIPYERLLLPFRTEQGTVNIILGVMGFQDVYPTGHGHPFHRPIFRAPRP